MPALLLLMGTALLLAGVTLLSWEAGIITAGGVLVLAGIDLRR